MGAHRFGLPVAIVAAIAAAGAATLSLRPRSGLIEPARVEAQAYFSAAQLEKARAYRGPQRALGFAGLALSGGVLVLVALRPPGRVRRGLDAAGSRPLLGAAAVGAGLSLTLVVVGLPIAAVSHQRAVDVGLSTQSWGPWLGDAGKSAAIGAALAGGGAAIGMAIVRRFRRHWWAPAAVAATAVSAVFVFLSPILLEPVFNRFEPLPAGRLRSEVIDLARRAGVDVGEVYRVDASRRTTGVNAYVGGLGETKRVVLYDNLIERFPPAEIRSVVAHELSHVKHRDLLRGLAWLAVVAPPAMLVVQRMTERLYRGAPAPAMLPALALSLALVSFAGGIGGNVLSRQVEARADAFALELTRDPDAHIGLERRLTVDNIADPDPPAVLHALFGTHPTTVERIGYGLAWSRGG